MNVRKFLALLLLADAAAFKFLTNFKAASLIPRPSAVLKRRRAAKTFGDKKLAVITGASSGVGLEAAARLIGTGEYHVFGAVRDLDKMRCVANDLDFPADAFTPLQVELDSFESVRAFCKDLEKSKLNRPIDRLICNAATYQPGEAPSWSADGHEQTTQVNFLSHFLLVSLLLPGMAMAPEPRVIMVGGAAAEEGVEVYPRAGLGALEGLKAGGASPVSMLDGSTFLGAKAYKDSKLSLGMVASMLHRRYHKQTGIVFSTAFPGAIADSALMAGKPPLDSSVALPGFVKTLADLELSTLKSLGIGDNLHADGLAAAPSVVTTAEAGARLFQVAHDVRCARSGFWSWREGAAAAEAAAAAEDSGAVGSRAGWESIYENEPSDQLLDVTLGQELWKHATLVTGASWPPANVPKSPCPTLKVVGAVTTAMNKKEEAKRTLHGIEPAEGGLVSGLGGKVLGSTGYVVDAIGGNTIGRVAKIAQDKLLGDIPEDAIDGTYQQTKDRDSVDVDAEARAAEWAEPRAAVVSTAAPIKFGDKKLVVVTGTSSGLGRKTAQALLRTGKYHVIGAVRDVDKMEAVAEIDGFDVESFTPMELELNSFASVRNFCSELHKLKGSKPVDRLICNAGIYQPSLPYAKWSADGHEQTMQVNYLSHFLLVSLLMEDLAKAVDPRVVLVGSVTGNDNTVGGGGVYPIADLKQLEGLKAGAKNPIAMFDGYSFIGAKAYKDSKLCLMMLSNILHDKYHRQTGITFSSIYPGCIAESPLFREKRPWFRKFFPVFMKYITGGFVGEEEAGQRLFQVAHDPRCSKSGVYWSWNGGPREGRGAEALEKGGQIVGAGGAGGGWDSIFENEQSDKVNDEERAADLFKYSTIATGAEWPLPNQPKSPSPTLKVIGAVTAAVNKKKEAELRDAVGEGLRVPPVRGIGAEQ